MLPLLTNPLRPGVFGSFRFTAIGQTDLLENYQY